jgi:hypothetical protein
LRVWLIHLIYTKKLLDLSSVFHYCSVSKHVKEELLMAVNQALGDNAAKQLANVTKTPPQYEDITPR